LHCPGCGTSLTEALIEGRLRPVCLACGQVVYSQLKVGAGVLVERDGALLLVRRGSQASAFPGTWGLPSGYCEVDEPPAVAAAREAEEETGLRVQVNSLADGYFFDDDPRGNGLFLVYEAQIVAGEIGDGWQPPQTDEVSAAGFFAADRLPQPLCGGGHDRAVAAWQARALDRWQSGLPPRYCQHCAHTLEEGPAYDQLRLVCPRCGFVHFRAPKVGVSVLIEHNDRLLLTQRAVDPGRGKWCLPSGFVEWDEAPEAAAARECREETGLVLSHLELEAATHYEDDFRGPGIDLAYRAQVASDTLQSGDDAASARWFGADELPPEEEVAFQSHRRLVARWQRQKQAGLKAADSAD